MTEFVLDQELKVAIEAVRRAARLCVAVRGSADPKTLSKGDLSPVTVADFGSQALVCRDLEAAFPADPVIAEESASALRTNGAEETRRHVLKYVRDSVPGATDHEVFAWIDRGTHSDYADRYWTLDPIDGTKGFLRGDQYAVALALVLDGSPSVAALACPNLVGKDGIRGILVAAVRGRGVTSQPLFEAGEQVRLHVSTTGDGALARFCESFESGHSSHGDAAVVASDLGIVKPPVRLDSQAKYAVVARGEADIYLRLPTRHRYAEKIWDHAAGTLVVQEAGGRVTDIEGRPLDFSRGRLLDQNRGVIVTNGILHDRVLEALAVVRADAGRR